LYYKAGYPDRSETCNNRSKIYLFDDLFSLYGHKLHNFFIFVKKFFKFFLIFFSILFKTTKKADNATAFFDMVLLTEKLPSIATYVPVTEILIVTITTTAIL